MSLKLTDPGRKINGILRRTMTKRVHQFTNLVIDETSVSEGSAKISVPKGQVFYNPVQQFNRDLSISVISAFQKKYLAEPKTLRCFPNKSGITIMEALSATGLRSIRYANEIPNVDHIIANDLDASAVELIKKNVQDNGIPDGKIIPNQDDAVYSV